MGLGSRRYLCHPMSILIILVGSWSWCWLVCANVLRLLRVEFVCRPVADLAVLFHVTVVGIGSGFHWDVGRERICGFIETVVACPVGMLSFVV